MPVGYTPFVVEDIRKANRNLIGVRLGLLCIERDIPTSDVAEYFGVSRVTVYKWFKGLVDVSDKHAYRVQQLIDKLS